jgi:hypothetical protein
MTANLGPESGAAHCVGICGFAAGVDNSCDTSCGKFRKCPRCGAGVNFCVGKTGNKCAVSSVDYVACRTLGAYDPPGRGVEAEFRLNIGGMAVEDTDVGN